MKTNAAFKSVLGLAVASTFFAASFASAQIKSVVAPKKSLGKTTAASQLKTNVNTTAAPVAPPKVFSLSLGGTLYSMPIHEKNFVETDISASFALADKVNLNFDTGFESYFYTQEANNGYDLEPSLVISDIEVLPALTFTTGLIGVVPTSRGSHEVGMMGGWGAKGNLALKVGNVGLGLDNQFYQYTYKGSDTPTPYIDDNLDDSKTYTNLNSVAFSILSAGIPVGPVTWKNDSRYRVKTPLMGNEIDQLRYRSRIAYTVNDTLSLQGGVYWQKQTNDPKVTESLFDSKFRVFILQMGVSI